MTASLVDLLRRRAAERPSQRAYTFLKNGEAEAAWLTYGELERRARALGARLQDLGMRGERAILLFPPGLEFVVGFFGCLFAGAVAVPAYPPRPRGRASALAAIAGDARPALVLTVSSLEGRVAAFAEGEPALSGLRWLSLDELGEEDEELWAARWLDPGVDSEDLAFLQYTSGSTAAPKGVRVSHGNLLHNEEMIRVAFGQSAESVIVSWLPLYHDMGLIGGVLQPLFLGASCVLMSPTAFLQRPARWLEAISRYGATTSGGPDFAYRLCLERAGGGADLDLSRWSVAFVGAEPVRPETLERFARQMAPHGFRPEAFYPCYGLAEATLFVTGDPPDALPRSLAVEAQALGDGRARPVDPSGGGGPTVRLTACGRAWCGQEVRAVDPGTGVPRPPGEVGEIWIAGPSVAGGYWERPEETARAFGARLAGEPDGRAFLRTGDLGFLLDGELYVTGRSKDLIILRGRNCYPQDVELTVERSHPGFSPGCGAAFSVEAEGGERLVVVQEMSARHGGGVDEAADAVFREVFEEHELRLDELVLVQAGTIPRTSSGKVRRAACRAAYLDGGLAVIGGRRSGGAPPLRSPAAPADAALPELIRRQVGEHLGVPAGEVPDDRPLVTLGLDSLSTVRLIHALEGLGIALSPARLLADCTLADLVAEAGAGRGRAPEAPVPAAGPPEGPVPLSHGQRALWFLQRLAPTAAAYNVAVAARLGPELDVEALRRAAAALVDRHPALRTVFVERDGEPWQVVRAQGEDAVRVEELDGPEELLRERLEEEAYRPFDLARGPLLRVLLWTRPRERVLLLVVHHIVVDFWSLSILAADLGMLYETAAAGREFPPPSPRATYADYVRWQRRHLEGERRERLRDYWERALAPLPPDLRLPADRPRGPAQSFTGGAWTFTVEPEVSQGVRALAGSRAVTLYTALLAAFQALLVRSSGSARLLVGSPTAGRTEAAFAETVGYFVNPVVLGCDLGDDPPFEEALARAQATVREALRHQDYPFLLLAERLEAGREPGRPPVFQAMFTLQKARDAREQVQAAFASRQEGVRGSLGGVALETLSLRERTSQVDLSLVLADVEGRIGGFLQYDAGLFDGATAERMSRHFRNLLAAAVAEPGRRVSELPMLDEAERRQLLRPGRPPLSPESLPARVAARARRSPGDPAVVGPGGEVVSYGELVDRAGRVAAGLRRLGVGPEVLVAVVLERSPALPAAVLGTLAAGGACLPLDPGRKGSWLERMLERSRCAVVLASGEALRRLPEHGALEARLEDLEAEPGGTAWEGIDPEQLAFAVPAAGSGSQPRFVGLPHRSVAAWVEAWAGRGGSAPETADGVLDLMLPLCTGGAVDLGLSAAGAERVEGGFSPALGGVWPELEEAGARVLGPFGEPVPAGVVGDLWLSGPGLARGYLDGRDRTAEHFIPDPWSPVPGGRSVRTGDRARWRPDGRLEILGPVEREPEHPPRDGGPESGEGPLTPVEEVLAGIWAQALGIERPGRHASFFELGGHSLLATRVISRVREVFQADLPLRAAFEAPTLARLARRIEEHRRREAAAPPPFERAPREGPLPLSFAQERLWFLDQMEPGDPWYNMPIALRLEGDLDAAALIRSLGEVARRHEVLRTAFRTLESGPVQAVLAPEPLELARVDLTGLPEAERRPAALRAAREEARRPFSLAAGRLLRGSLLRLGDREHALLLTLHHIVADGWSLGLFVQELSALYRGGDLPQLPVQYADFAVWQREWLSGAVLETQLAWWRGHLAGAPALLELPADRPRPAVRGTRGGRAPLSIRPELVRELERLSLRESATLFMTLFAGFQSLLGRLAGREDLVVGTPIAGRTRPEVEGLIGLFVNTLALRGDLSGDPAFGEHLARVREASLGAYAHQDLPFERLVEELAPERTLTHSPVFQVLFVFQNAPPAVLELPGLTWSLLDSDSGTAKFDLTLTLQEEGEGLVGHLGFNRDLFDDATARRWAGHLGVLLEGIVREPEKRLSERELMSASERHQVVLAWNDTARGVVEETLHGLFAAQVRRAPEAAAVRFEGAEMTFGELDRRSNRLARFLRGHGVGPDVLVGLCMERSPELVVGVLGILKAGGGYVPLDPGYPADRLAYMMEDSGAPVMLGQQRLLDRMPGSGAPRVLVDADWERIAAYGDEPLPELADTDHLACVLYTSGSTGRPKGVMDSHRCVINQLRWLQSTYRLDGTDRVLQKTPISWDVSLWELFWPLTSGACMVLAVPGGHQDPRYLASTISQERITTVHFVPSMLRIFLESESAESCGSLRRVVSSGEALGLDLEEKFFASFTVDLNNMYGPGESARTTLWRCERGNTKAIAPIGRPTHDTQVYVLDRRMEPVPVGVTGEIWVASQSMARGYHRRPDLTAEKFLPNPFGAFGTRLYRTGDLGRTLPDGTLEFLGRIDHQVKIRGVRIELGEIETALGRHPKVSDAVVMARSAGSEKRLAAYVVPAQPLTVEELREHLLSELPSYMVPESWTLLEAMPLAPNGKADRDKLPEPEWVTSRRDYVAPGTPTEQILAGIWAGVLETGREIGAHDDFFGLGGHSLLATRVTSQVRKAFGVELPVRAVFEEPTLAGLAARVDAARQSAGRPAAPPLVVQERSGDLPLSFAQERLWFVEGLLAQLGPGAAVYNIASAVPWRELIDPEVLARSLDEIVRRHEILRTTFTVARGRPVQVVHPFLKPGLRVLDRSGLPAGQRRAEVERLGREEAREPFDLSRGPLLRAVLVRLGPEENVLLLTFHHIVSDGWSSGIFLRELAELLAAFRAGLPSPLPSLALQYADFALWQRDWLRGEPLESLLAYWRTQLAGAPPVLRLPTDFPRPEVQTYAGALLPFELPRPLADQVSRLSQRQGATLFMTLLAAFLVLLYRYTGEEDLVVGSPVAGRNRAELEGLIGIFVNTLVLRVPVSGDQSFQSLVARVREVTLEAYDHQDVPFEKLVEELAPGRDLSHTPLCQVLFNLQITPAWARTEEAREAVVPHSGTAKFDLNLTLAETGLGLQGAFEYNTDLFAEPTVLRLRDHWIEILAAVAADPEIRLLDVPLGMGDTAEDGPAGEPPVPRLDEAESFAF